MPELAIGDQIIRRMFFERRKTSNRTRRNGEKVHKFTCDELQDHFPEDNTLVIPIHLVIRIIRYCLTSQEDFLKYQPICKVYSSYMLRKDGIYLPLDLQPQTACRQASFV